MKLYFLLIFTMLLLSFNYAFAQGDQTKDIFDHSEIITAIIVAPIGGLVGYILKRHYVNKDFEFQQKVEHQHWLLQQFSPLVSEYYVPIAKFAFDSVTHIKRSQSSKNEQAIKIAFYHTCLFLSKYITFKNNKGANFLFKNRDYEYEAILAIRAILASLPFDDQDLIEIHKHIINSKTFFEDSDYVGNTFEKFKAWILSNNCKKSRELIMKKLDYLQRILDQNGEEISHPELINKSRSILKIETKDDDIFFILFSSIKTAKQGESIQIFGGGFKHERVKYELYIGNTKVADKQNSITDDVNAFNIPEDLEIGTYDIFSKFIVKRGDKKEKEETIGIPIQII